MCIAIAGNIWSGKGLLAELLSGRLGWDNVSVSQNDGENPYIDDFYDDMRRWSFQLQIYFLGMRWRSMRGIAAGGRNCVIDRTIYEDAEIFARNLFKNGLLPERSFHSYFELYGQVIDTIKAPDLLVYIRATPDKLLRNIKRRGRGYETSIDKSYLQSLGELYENWTFSYGASKILTIDLDSDDFILDSEARERVLDKICSIIKKQ